jgi:O-antigen/teichoic acid export membrane protein
MKRSKDALYRLALSASNRMLGMNAKQYMHDAWIVTISHGISVLRGLITGFLVARLFPRELYGEYQFILSVFGALTFLSLPGIDKSLPRAVARGEGGALPRMLKWHVLISLLGTVALLFSLPILEASGRGYLWPVFVIAAILFPCTQAASSLFGALVSGLGRFDVALKANITWSVLMVAATLFIIFVEPSSTLLFVAGVTLPALSYLWFSRPLMPRHDPAIPVRPILRYSIEMTLLSLPLYFSTYIDKLLISAFFGLNQLAVFAVGILIPEQLKSWSKELLPVSLASQAKGKDSPERRKVLLRVIGRATLLSVIPLGIGIAITPFILPWIFPNYPEAILLTQVGLAMLIFQPGALISQYMEAQAMIREMRWAQWISAAIYIVSLVVLLPSFGLVGAVIGRGVLRCSTIAISIWFLARAPKVVTA